MKKILILGASRLQEPLILMAKNMGLYTIVVDKDENAVGKKNADEFYAISTIDEKKVYYLAEKIQPDAIVTAATDMPMRTVAYVSEKLRLKAITYETALRCTDKILMAEALADGKVNRPKFFVVESKNKYSKKKLITNMDFPVIVKPSDSSGSRGVTKVERITDIEKALNHAFEFSKNGKILVEEYISGSEVSVELLIQNGVPRLVAITDKITSGSPHFIEKGHTQPSQHSEEIKAKIKQLAFDAIKALRIDNGAAHVEIKINELNIPYIIEVGARLGGDFITSHLTTESTKYSMLKGLIEIALGKELDFSIKEQTDVHGLYFVMNNEIGKFNGINNWDYILEQYKSKIVSYDIFTMIGQKLEPNNSSSDRLGYILIRADNYSQLMSIYHELDEELKTKVEL